MEVGWWTQLEWAVCVCVATVDVYVLEQSPPVGVSLQQVRIADHDEQSTSPGDGNVEALQNIFKKNHPKIN